MEESNDLTELKNVAETEDPRAHLQNNYVNVAVGMFGNQEGKRGEPLSEEGVVEGEVRAVEER